MPLVCCLTPVLCCRKLALTVNPFNLKGWRTMSKLTSNVTGQELTPFEKEVEEFAERILDQDIYCNQSMLVTELMGRDVDGFTYDEVTNMRPNTGEWTVAQCREWIGNYWQTLETPEDPSSMSRERCVELLASVDIECNDDETIATLREAVEVNIDDGTIDGIDEWRQIVDEHAEPAEVYEWWAVNEYFAAKLIQHGECVLDNDYGYWWGRQATGQAILMDGTLQNIARETLQAHR